MKLNKIDEVWNSANSLFEWRFRFVVIQKFILPWQRDVTTSLLYVPCFWIKSYYNFEQHTSCITYVCNTCLVLSLNSVLPSVLPPRRHGLLSETRNEGFCCLPFLLTQVLVRNCSTRYEFLTNGSRWEGRGKGWEGRGKLCPSHTNVWKIPRLCGPSVTDCKVFFPAVFTDLGSIFADWIKSKERVYFFNNT